jgi:O-antigen/teichoic acid export membrane protein
MPKLKKNIVANFVGSVWTGLMGLIFVPLYIKFMGIEAYGLIGIFATLLAIFGLLDMGLSGTLNREIARLAVQGGSAREMRDLVRTLEIPYWVVGLFLSVIVIMLSPFIAHHWVKAESLAPKTVQTAIMIMGLAVAFQWPISFYSGGLMGLQCQVLLNSINIVMSTFRALGAVLILWLVSPTIEAFFTWQIVTSVIHVGLIGYSLWRSLPTAAVAPRFRSELLQNIWRFAAGMTGTTLMVTILTQLDKVILSRMLSLQSFGYYTLAGVVALTLYRLITPVFTAVYPRLTNLVALNDTIEITRLYHKSAQLVSVLVLPVALVVAFFSKEILLLWTQNTETAASTHSLVSILVMGTAINGLMNIPYALQLANGWTRLALLSNVVSVLLLVPLMIAFTKWYGAVGSASVWVILNVGYFFICIPIMHRRLLNTEKWRWYFKDVGLPFVVAVLVAGTFRLFLPIPINDYAIVAMIAMISLVTLGSTAAIIPVTREWFNVKITSWSAVYAAKSRSSTK